jgi:hypothetical protein
VGKQKRAPFPHQAKYRAEDVLELVHGDICGSISPATPSGNHYFILLVDDASQYMWLKVLASKDGASAAIKQYQAASKAETGRKLWEYHSDRGGEFNSTEFASTMQSMVLGDSSQCRIHPNRTTSWKGGTR